MPDFPAPAPAVSMVQEHIETICDEAGLDVMSHVLSIVADREEVAGDVLLALTSDDIYPMYEAWVGPAVDKVEKSLLGDFG